MSFFIIVYKISFNLVGLRRAYKFSEALLDLTDVTLFESHSLYPLLMDNSFYATEMTFSGTPSFSMQIIPNLFFCAYVTKSILLSYIYFNVSIKKKHYCFLLKEFQKCLHFQVFYAT